MCIVLRPVFRCGIPCSLVFAYEHPRPQYAGLFGTAPAHGYLSMFGIGRGYSSKPLVGL